METITRTVAFQARGPFLFEALSNLAEQIDGKIGNYEGRYLSYESVRQVQVLDYGWNDPLNVHEVVALVVYEMESHCD